MKRLQLLALLLLFATMSVPAAAEELGGRKVVWDTDELTEEEIPTNPFNILVFMYTTRPVTDHNGEFHHHGHIIQLIQDGGNRIQDPPLPDGSPGGDDSLALGNFNSVVMRGVKYPYSLEDQTGQFFTKKYFVPLLRDEVYYLRIWEGDDVATAPYYQNTTEYYNPTTTDKGGGMVRISPNTIQGPQELDWVFGKPTLRPKKK